MHTFHKFRQLTGTRLKTANVSLSNGKLMEQLNYNMKH